MATLKTELGNFKDTIGAKMNYLHSLIGNSTGGAGIDLGVIETPHKVTSEPGTMDTVTIPVDGTVVLVHLNGIVLKDSEWHVLGPTLTIVPEHGIWDNNVSTVLYKTPMGSGGGGAGALPKEEEITGTRLTVNTSGTRTLDWSLYKVFELSMTGNTTLTDINLPTLTETKVIELVITGNKTLTLPSYWEAMPNNDTYNGNRRNHLVVSCIKGSSKIDIIYSLQNLGA